MAFIVTRRQDKEQQQVHSLLRSPPEPQSRCPSSEVSAVAGFTDTQDTEGCSVSPAKSREVRRALLGTAGASPGG